MTGKENINIDSIRNQINKIQLSDKLNRTLYDSKFYAHVSNLMKFYFLTKAKDNKEKIQKFKLNERNYHAIEQSIFEDPYSVELENPNPIDWQLVDDAREIFKGRVKKLLGTEGTSDHLKPIVKCTADAFENWLMYKLYFPKSVNNPWIPTTDIIDTGLLFLISDDRDVLEQYQKKIYNKVENINKGNIGLIAKSSKNEFSGLVLDERVSDQAMVLNYLRTHARGVNHAKPIKSIIKFLSQHNRNSTALFIKNQVNLPLKRAGIIGSTNAGYYYIETYEDLKYTYDNHKEKIDAIQRTLNTFIKRGKDMGYPNFPEK